MEGTEEQDDMLFSAAWWAKDSPEKFFHYESIDSPTVRQAQARCAQNFPVSPYLTMDPTDPDAQLAQKLEIQTMCSVPVDWTAGSWGKPGTLAGVVNFYRRRPEPFSTADFETAQSLAKCLLALLVEISNRRALNLLREVAVELSPSIGQKSGHAIPAEERKQKLDRVAAIIAKHFECHEVSIYLERPMCCAGVHCEGTTWPWKMEQKNSYDPGEGFTGYCFQQQRSITIFDLRRINEDADLIRTRYPGSRWSQSVDLNEIVNSKEKGEGGRPPVSFLAVPILLRNKACGVLRCSAVSSSPYYFVPGEEQLLSLIAGQIGEWQGAQNDLQLSKEENRWLADFIKDIGNLASQADGDRQMTTMPMALLKASLAAGRKAIPAAHSGCVRLENRGSLLLACHDPDPVEEWGTAQAEKIYTTVMPLEGPSAAAKAYNSGLPVLLRDFDKFPKMFFPEVEALIVAPVWMGESNRYGTIEMRFNRSEDISEYAVSVLTLLGSQIGQHLFLAKAKQKLAAAEVERQDLARIQLEAFENLGHQLKTPIAHARMIADDLVYASATLASRDSYKKDAATLCAHLRRAEQVAWNNKRFGDLAAGRPLTLELSPLTEKAALEQIELALTAIRMRSSGALTFTLKKEGFAKLVKNRVVADLELLAQMLDNLLDNAKKYAAIGSEVVVSGDLTMQDKYFYISVANRGRTVDKDLAKKITQRGVRSFQVVSAGAEGSGLGLYLAKEFLNAHRGKLEVIPTDPVSRMVKFRLLFPIQSAHAGS
jgi:signal transduction histidine kinase